jgi:NAD+ diphosphatase
MNYCYKCGQKLVLKECFNCGVSEGNVPFCDFCEEFRFPFFNVAVSMVVFNKDFSKTLLIKQYGKNNNILVAGYVSKEENLEHTVIRELKEEVGLTAISIQYNESQYFDKSNTLINNFIVQVENENYTLNPEVDSAHWFNLFDAKKYVLQNGLAEYFLKLAISKITSPAKI